MHELNLISRDIEEQITMVLTKAGILFRIFNRVKSVQSIKRKIDDKQYRQHGKKIQDCIGIRIAVYFSDDIDIVVEQLKINFSINNETIDITKEDLFGPTRVNIVFNLPDVVGEDFKSICNHYKEDLVDTTFEIQIRTILSEGWHEVEHDLRYKCKQDWNEHIDLSRALNGIYATLETSDWSMIQLFEQMAHRNYKQNQWSAMLRNKFRIRIAEDILEADLQTHLNNNLETAKKIYKIDRKELLHYLFNATLKFTLSVENILYFINFMFVKDDKIISLMPKAMKKSLEKQYGSKRIKVPHSKKNNK